MGYTRAMFIYGLDSLDEIFLSGTTRINELRGGNIRIYEICPEDFGLRHRTLEDIKIGTPGENSATIQCVFSGKITGPRKDAIILNAAGALIVGGKADNFEEGIHLARETIESGQAVDFPILRKDFIQSKKGVEETAGCGVKAILLICACMEESLLRELYQTALEWELAPLVETHSSKELELAASLGARLAGVSNWGILTLE